MQALTFWKTIVEDRAGFLEGIVSLLAEHHIPYCLVGGQAVNAYVEPVVSLDLGIVVAAGETERLEELLKDRFEVRHFPHSTNVSQPGSDLRVQIQTDPRYAPFVERASLREVMGLVLPVAAVVDVLQGKLWAVADPERRASKRQKDLADIARLLEAYSELRARVPASTIPPAAVQENACVPPAGVVMHPVTWPVPLRATAWLVDPPRVPRSCIPPASVQTKACRLLAAVWLYPMPGRRSSRRRLYCARPPAGSDPPCPHWPSTRMPALHR